MIVPIHRQDLLTNRTISREASVALRERRLRVVDIGGTLVGVTKNALDFMQFLARDERHYLEGRVVGLISTSGGERAAANTTDAMVHVVHALRGRVAPSMVTITRAWRSSDGEGNITDETHGKRLVKLGGLVVEMADNLNAGDRRVEAPGVAV